MALTPRFHELINELDLPEAVWHLKRMNSWTDKNATEEDIRSWQKQILDLLTNKNDCVRTLLEETEAALQECDTLDRLLLKRQETVMRQWREPISNNGTPHEYTAIIQAISRRQFLEKTRERARVILAWGFQILATSTSSSKIPISFTIAKAEPMKGAA